MKILYIATREASYSRVSIVHRALSGRCSVRAILSNGRSYPVRLLLVATRFLLARFTGRLKETDAVFVGFLAQPILPLIRLLWHGPIVADAYLSVYDTLVHDKQRFREGTLLARLTFWLDQYMLRHADLCFADTQEHVKYFRATFQVSEPNVKRVWVSSEYKRIDKLPRDVQPFRVFFWGGFIPLQGVDTIVRAASKLLEHNVHFTVVGRGQTYDRCVQLQRELQATNIEFIDWMTPREIASFAGRAQLVLGIFGTTQKAARVIPNKVFQALAMGVPVITGDSAAVREMLKDNVDVLLVPRGNAEQLAAKILWVRDHLAEAQKIGRRGHQTFQRIASPERVEKALHTEIAKLKQSRQPALQQRADPRWSSSPR